MWQLECDTLGSDREASQSGRAGAMDVSREAALAACDQVRAANARHFLSAGHWQCWGCIRFGGEPEKSCMRTAGGWDGCVLVNRQLAAPKQRQVPALEQANTADVQQGPRIDWRRRKARRCSAPRSTGRRGHALCGSLCWQSWAV
jgi:hypothetical protein